MLNGTGAIYRRELSVYFRSASTYVVLGLLFLVVGIIYHQLMDKFTLDSAMAAAGGPFMTSPDPPNITVAVIEGIFEIIAGMMIFTTPVLSMRLLSAEKSSGTFEVLVTCPISDWAALLGKYAALVTLGLVIVSLSSIYPLSTFFFGRNHGAIPELPVVLSCALLLLLLFSTYGAFGLMASALTQSQVIASVVTLVGLLIWNMIGAMEFGDPALLNFVKAISPLGHSENFLRGLFSSIDLAFFVLASFSCLFLAARILEARRWRI